MKNTKSATIKVCRRFSVLTVFPLALSSATVLGQGVEFYRQIGSFGHDYAFATAVDSTGVYVVGQAQGALPGAQSWQGWFDAFLRKYDHTGNLLWTRQFGSPLDDSAMGAATYAGSLYVAGFTSGALTNQPNAGFTDAFLRKYDTNGNVLWTRQFGTGGWDKATAIVADAAGVYVVGETSGSFTRQPSSGNGDCFVKRYDPSGNLLWTQQFDSGEPDYVTSVAIAEDSPGIWVVG
jgi:hypothetical protein